MERWGIPSEYAKTLAAMDTAISEGSEERTNDVVLRVTGRAPKSFKDFVKEGVDRDIWVKK